MHASPTSTPLLLGVVDPVHAVVHAIQIEPSDIAVPVERVTGRDGAEGSRGRAAVSGEEAVRRLDAVAQFVGTDVVDEDTDPSVGSGRDGETRRIGPGS